MANLIDNTYFIGEINLPGSALSGDNADITDFISKYEKQALIDLLGYTLYKELKTEIDAASYTTKWDRLVNGYEYTVTYNGDEHLVKWEGLVNTEKISLLAYYIYYHYVSFHVTHTSGFGELLQQAENANRISAQQKIVNAWNQFILLRGGHGESCVVPTCYNFLDENEDDYDKWLFKVIRRTNTFGL